MMNRILIVEDNPIKLEKIVSLFEDLVEGVSIDTASSFNSGWLLLQKNRGEYDLIILDLSLPSFDSTISIDSGEFRSLGGKELAHKLVKRKVNTPFLFLTAYSVFDDKVYKYTFDELKKELTSKYPEQCLGVIFFNSKGSEWRKEIKDSVRGII
ncbi:response regulator transcription factor [Aliivibrio fischeri]|nr:response regulator [Aliivibrio fischeri]